MYVLRAHCVGLSCIERQQFFKSIERVITFDIEYRNPVTFHLYSSVHEFTHV